MSDITPAQARLLALLVTVLWSSSWVLIRFGLDDLEPITFAGLRYGFAAVVLAFWISARRGRLSAAPASRPHRRRWRWTFGIVGLGVVQYAVTQGSQFIAIKHQPAATTNLLLVTTPLVVAFLGALIDEPPTPRHFVSGGIALTGMAIYFAGELGATTTGMIAATVAVSGNAFSALLGRVVNRRRRWPTPLITLATMSIGAVILLAIGTSVEGLPRFTPEAALIVGWLAVVNTALAFTWWNVSLRELPAFEVSTIQNAMGIQIPLLGWIFLSEALGPAEIAGLGLTAVGVWLATSRRRRVSTPPQMTALSHSTMRPRTQPNATEQR